MQLNIEMIQDAVGITASRDEEEALFSSSLEGPPPFSPLGDSVPSSTSLSHVEKVVHCIRGGAGPAQ